VAKELVVISGKGGTGKTSIVAALAALGGKQVLADCDVDAADLHLVLSPTIVERQKFSGGSRARIMPGHCTACGKCEELCRFDAISFDGPGNGKISRTFRVDPVACEGCGVCAYFCAEDAIEFAEAVNGEWYVSETRMGPMVHAKLGVAEENSGKLVSLVRTKAKELAEQRGLDRVLIDGSPGIGCPVIASVSGADATLVITEPTLSGLHDLGRVADLTDHFQIPTMVCVNKWDLNEEIAGQVEQMAKERGLDLAGRIRYDPLFTQAQIGRKTIIEHRAQSEVSVELRALWERVETAMDGA
jgi:MinD superfamily P-loop ATPase